MTATLATLLGRNVLRRPHAALIEPWLGRPFGRPFGRSEALRCVVFYERKRISFSQAFPFLYYADAFRRRLGVEIRMIPIDRLPSLPDRVIDRIDVALVQILFKHIGPQSAALFERLLARRPDMAIAYMDAFAHNDLRPARFVEPYVRWYCKKALFRDRGLHLKAFRGDTNLTEYYGDLYGIEADPVDWATPPAILDRLRLTPNFFTAPILLEPFLRAPAPAPQRARSLDVHARMETRGSPWYQRMREAALACVEDPPGPSVATGIGAPWPRYMAEMGDAKLCLSPFGYGEVCWRDMEAFLAGSVLIKPDMGHLETAPELYRPGETYLPVRWDFADLRETVEAALADPDRCDAIAARAREMVRAYLAEGRFVDDMAFLFAPAALDSATAIP